jgi:hypothetical protein
MHGVFAELETSLGRERQLQRYRQGQAVGLPRHRTDHLVGSARGTSRRRCKNALRDACSWLTAVVFFCWYSATEYQNVTVFSLSMPEWHFTFGLVELTAFLSRTDH